VTLRRVESYKKPECTRVTYVVVVMVVVTGCLVTTCAVEQDSAKILYSTKNF
jgi:hypothetical protein